MSDNRTTELLHVGDILWNEPCDERIVVVAANERNVWLRKVQKNDELAMHDGHVWSMLGKKCNVKNMCTQSYAQSVFEYDGHVEQAIAATLGEQIVRCRDCKYYHDGTSNGRRYAEPHCLAIGELAYGALFEVDEDCFCSWGERKEVDE